MEISTYTLLPDEQQQNWPEILKELGFRSTDFNNLKSEMLIVFGDGFQHIGFLRVSPDCDSREAVQSADVLLVEVNSRMTLRAFGGQLDKMVKLTKPGGEIRIYGLPLDAVPTMLQCVSERFGQAVEAASEIAYDRSRPNENVIVRLFVRLGGTPDEPADKSYGIYW